MKKATQLLLCFLFFMHMTNSCSAQKDYWSVLFPGFLSNSEFTSNIAPDQTLNLSLNNADTTQPNKFVSLDKNGLVVFQQNTNEIALLNFKDSIGDRYLVSYIDTILHIQKYNPQNTLLWDNLIPVPYAIPSFASYSVGGSEEIISPSQFLFLSNGNLLIEGVFSYDTTSFSATNISENLDFFFINVNNGSLINHFVNTELLDYPYYTNIQEDNSGNINFCYYAETFSLTLGKFTPTGTLLNQLWYGNIFANNPFDFVKFSNHFIYVGMDSSGYINVIKLGSDLLDTIYVDNIYSPGWDPIGGFFDGNDSAFYIQTDSGLGVYDYNGALTCLDSTNNNSIRFMASNSNCYYLSYGGFFEKDTACLFTNCTKPLDTNTQLLAWGGLSEFTSTPGYNFSGKDVLYIASNTSYFNGVFGIIGLIDSKPNDFKGRLYFDANANCVLDSNEVGIPNQLIKIDPLNKYAFTNDSGYFQNYLDTGSYVLSAIPFNNTLTFCPVSIPLTITDTALVSGGNNFAVQDQAGNLEDLSISVNQILAVPGYFSDVFLTVKNTEPIPASGYIKLTIDSSIFSSLLYANPFADSISGNNYYWHVSNLNFYAQVDIYASFQVKTSATLGAAYTTSALIVNTAGENNLANNSDVYQGTVVGSFDPNTKSVVPSGQGPNGSISLTDSVLNYKIQFQNTGTYLAYTVKVIDTIDVNLDISTFRLLSTSHPCKVTFLAANVLLFTFANIMLPDSSSNEILSHGFINYSIQTKPNLPLSTQIKNKAYIYFDFNQPVVTNQTVNTTAILAVKENTKSFGVSLYPNPAKDEITVTINDKKETLYFSIYDIEGRIIESNTITLKNNSVTLPLTMLHSGFYFLKIESGDSSAVKSFVKL